MLHLGLWRVGQGERCGRWSRGGSGGDIGKSETGEGVRGE